MKKYVCIIMAAIIVLAAASGAFASLYISSGNPPNGTVGKSYRATFNVSGSTSATLSWEISGYFPGVLTTTKTGTGASISISGTPTSYGSFNIYVKVKNGNNESDSKSYTVIIAENDSGGGDSGGGTTVETLSISGYLNADKVGSQYPENLYGELIGKATVDGGTPPYTWSVIAGDLPKGTCLACANPDTGLGYIANNYTGIYTVLQGVPSLGGEYFFILQVKDAKGNVAIKDFSVNVKGGDLDEIEIAGDFDNAVAKWNYSYYFTNYDSDGVYISSGGREPYTWSVVAGELPSGLSLSGATSYGKHCAKLSGKPSKPGRYSFVLKVTDSDGRTATKACTVEFMHDSTPPSYGTTSYSESLPVISGTFGSGTPGKAYSGYVTASDGKAPYTWSVSDGELPPGVSLTASSSAGSAGSGTTGKYAHLSGTPSAYGYYNFTLKVTDANGNTSAKTFAVGVTGLSSGGSSGGDDDNNNNNGDDNNNDDSNNNNNDDSGGNSSTQDEKPVVRITRTKRLPSAKVNYSYDYVRFMGDRYTYGFSVVDGAAPEGLTLNTVNYSTWGNVGEFSGRPEKSGVYTFTVKAEYSGKTYHWDNYALPVYDLDMKINADQLDDVMVWDNYSDSLYLLDFPEDAGICAVTSGALPDGLTLSNSGEISGRPTKAGSYTFTVTISSGIYSASREYTINVVPDPISVAINATNFPDSAFRSLVSEKYDKYPCDGYLSGVEIRDVTEMKRPSFTEPYGTTQNTRQHSLKGIEYFTALKTLYCNDLGLDTLDVSRNVNLEKLECYENFLTELVIGNKLYLTRLKCSGQRQRKGGDLFYGLELDLSLCPKLTDLIHTRANVTTSGGTVLRIGDSSDGVMTLSSGTQGQYYSNTLTANISGTKWELQAGNKLPYGLSLNAWTGAITGTPKKPGTYRFEVIASNGTKYASRQFEMTVEKAVPAVPANSVAINAANFPNSRFRSYLSGYIDKNNDGYLVQDEMDSLRTLTIHFWTGLPNTGLPKGIEYFKNISLLDCTSGDVKALDVSVLPNLTWLMCYSCDLEQLTLGDNTNLKYIYCRDTKLKQIDVSGCPNLELVDVDEGVQVIGRNGVIEPEAAGGDVAVSAANFPDTVFRAYVSENFDKDSN